MSVTPIDNGDGTWNYIHMEQPTHTGELDLATVTYGKNPDGSDNTETIVIPCPDCDSVSYWPASTIESLNMEVNKKHGSA